MVNSTDKNPIVTTASKLIAWNMHYSKYTDGVVGSSLSWSIVIYLREGLFTSHHIATLYGERTMSDGLRFNLIPEKKVDNTTDIIPLNTSDVEAALDSGDIKKVISYCKKQIKINTLSINRL